MKLFSIIATLICLALSAFYAYIWEDSLVFGIFAAFAIVYFATIYNLSKDKKGVEEDYDSYQSAHSL